MRRMKPEEFVHREAVAAMRRSFLRRFGFGRKECPFFHAANENSGTAAWRSKLTALGLGVGVSDLVVVWPTASGAPGLAMELKSLKGKDATPEQQRWLALWHAAGFSICVAKGHLAAASKLFECGYIESCDVGKWLDNVRAYDPSLIAE